MFINQIQDIEKFWFIDIFKVFETVHVRVEKMLRCFQLFFLEALELLLLFITLLWGPS